MNETGNNPYSPPAAVVEDASYDNDEGTFIPGGRSVPAGNGAGWLAGGWEQFTQQPWRWIGLTLLFVVLYLVTIIPYVKFAMYVVMPVITGGIVLACDRQRSTGKLKIGDLFSGFQNRTGPLLTVGALYVGLMILALIPVVLVVGLNVVVAAMSGSPHPGAGMVMPGIASILIGGGISFVLYIMLCMAMWFAPALVVLQEMSAAHAMKTSFAGCAKNILPGLIYVLVLIAAAIVATIPIGLGWFALVPTMFASVYAAYRDVYIAH
ncbi:MAG TPA: BPSS1780 family membrane protein [Rhodocyclaceae bacterium]|nr:BPSS1780 family membrane protein [Rhodocyclaceae bacterium]